MFVCTGNICRSPMAHYYFQKLVNDSEFKNDFLVSSSGTNAYNGQKATDFAIAAIKEYGVDMENHRSTNIFDSSVEQYDYIITMTLNHKKTILNTFPSLKEKVYTLIEFVDNSSNNPDIDDPWGYGMQVYKDTAKQIVYNVDKLFEIITKDDRK